MTTIREEIHQELLEEQFSPSKSNRASGMGRNCIRRLYFERVCPEHKTPFSAEALKRMKEGTIQEKNVRGWLTNKEGYDISRSQEPFEFKDLQLTGHWEGFLKRPQDKEPVLFEIKTCSEFKFRMLNDIKDFYDGKWWEGYLNQATVYMKASGQDKILFLVKDRSSWDIKEFEYEFDEFRWESIQDKCNVVNTFIDKLNETPQNLPEYCNQYKECDDCLFLNHCNPDRVISLEGYKRVNDQEVIDIVTRHQELKAQIKPLEKEYKDLDKHIKSRFKGVEGAFIGEQYEVIGKLIPRKGYTVEPSEYWSMKIKEL